MTNFPFTDEFMRYDKQNHRYVLTDKDVLNNLGINLSARINDPNTISALLKQVSMQVYTYIHQFNIENDFQDYVIAKTETGRKIIKEAMEQQLLYFLTVGDLSRSADVNQRALWFDEAAKQILLTPIPEIGVNICYTGKFRFSIPNNAEW